MLRFVLALLLAACGGAPEAAHDHDHDDASTHKGHEHDEGHAHADGAAKPDDHAENGEGHDGHDHGEGHDHAAHAEGHDHAAHAKGHDHAAHAHAAGGQALDIPLNDGAKWAMDDHTRAVMAEARATLDGAKVASVADATALSATLNGQLSQLIKGCTMEGAAHEALHGFLKVYMPAVAALGQATSVDAAQSQVTQYGSFFE
jgi:hypothetical protein